MRRNGPRVTYFVDRPAVSVGATPRDKIGVALDRFLGVQADTLERIVEAAVFSDRVRARLATEQRGQMRLHGELPGLRATSFEEVRQALEAEQASWQVSERVREAQVSSDLAAVLGNTLNRALLSSYVAPDFGERTLFVPGVARDLRDQRVVAIDAAPDVPDIDPESVNYGELPKLAERVMTGVMGQKGVIVSITRKVVVNNDVGVVQRLVDELGRAARRTLARAVWAVWTSNATFAPDGVAWFNGAHNNLQTTAISEAEVIAAIRKLLDQTQPGNAEKLGTRVQPGSLWLTVPHALWDTAYKLNQTTASALYHVFGEENEYVIVNPLLTDANDWGVHRDANEVESIRVNFLNGREEPEFLIADLPNADQLFIGDRILYKLRHEWGLVLSEFRGAVKAQVP